MIDNRAIQLVTTKPEAELAADYKARAVEALRPMLSLMDEAAEDGFLIRWMALQPNAFGKHEAVDLHLVKRF